MSTRGAIGFRVNGQDKITYNHSDSYPEGLGDSTLAWLRGELAANEETALRGMAVALRVVNEDIPPSAEDVASLKQWADLHVGLQSANDWYCLLRNTQGDPAAILACGVMTDGATFLQDSLFCEWAYIVNFDERQLEVYKGFQRQGHNKGRYAARKPKDWTPEYRGQEFYYPVKLIAALPFDELPETLVDALSPAHR